LNEFDFFSDVLEKLSGIADCESVSVFQYERSRSLLKSLMKIKGELVFEQEERIYFEENQDFKKSLMTMKPFVYKIAAANFLYVPYAIGNDFDLSAFREDNVVFFRFEKFGNRKFGQARTKAVSEKIAVLMRNFYEIDFNLLKNNYSKNILAARDLSRTFASSIRETDSFKAIISGLRRHFGFDRIRLYLVEEEEKKLVGSYSIDITGRIKSLDYDKILLEKGAHRFADMVLGDDFNAFADYYKDCVFYLPLKIQNRPMGLLIFDNLLSQMKITNDEIQILKSFAGQIAMAVDNISLFRKIQELSLHDELTRLPMRRYFNSRFQEEFYRAERFTQPLSVIWIDIDYFKEINDTYGHQIGDAALKEVSRVIISSLRKIDFPCRYGGDEIIIMLPQAGDTEAFGLAGRLLNEIKNIKIEVPFSVARQLGITASIGIATYPVDAVKMDELLARADEALYWIKSHGRDGIKTYSEMKKEEKKEAEARDREEGAEK